jgi:hypothetical protein
MRCAKSVHTRLVDASKLCIGLLVLGIFACTPVVPAHAQNTSVDATVYDGQPAALTITAPSAGAVFDSSPVSVTLSVHNIGQVMVYIDGAYSHTVAVDIGASQMVLSIAVPIGSHDITVQGLDPFTSNSVPDLVPIVYNPSAEPSSGGSSGVPGVVQRARQGVVDTSAYLNEQVDQAATTSPAGSLSALMYRGMIALDIASPSANAESLNKMFLRFWMVSVGAALLVLAHPIFISYHWLRYQVLKWNVHALPNVLRHHAVPVLRIIGLALIIMTFILVV